LQSNFVLARLHSCFLSRSRNGNFECYE